MPLYLCWWGLNIGAQAMNLVCYCLAPIGFGSRSLCMPLLKCRLRFGTTKNTMLIGWGLKEDKMKKINLFITVLLLVPLLSFGQSPYTSYYENGKIKVAGEGFNERIKHVISVKSGLNLRESPDLKSKKIAKIPYGISVAVKSKTGIKLTVIDTDKETGITKSIEGEWVKIGAEFYLSPGDEGYAMDLIDPSFVEGYVFDGFLKKEKYLVQKPGVWTYYFESGVINEEVFYGEGEIIKKITYDTDGDVTEIEEHQGDYDWGRHIIVNFHKNGKVKFYQDSEAGGAVNITFDEYGNILENNYGTGVTHGDVIILSKDIRDFYLSHNELVNKTASTVAAADLAAPVEGKSMLEKISGRWKTDIKALNAENKRTGKPSETASSGYFEITDKEIISARNGDKTKIPFYLANDSIWETGICRGDDFDIAKFIIKHHDNNGTVLVQIEDWGAACYTIEKITDRKMVLGYVGARLNLHFYMR